MSLHMLRHVSRVTATVLRSLQTRRPSAEIEYAASCCVNRSWGTAPTSGVLNLSRRAYHLHPFNLRSDVGAQNYGELDEHGDSGAAHVAARGWQIVEEKESDWKSHAAAVANSVGFIKSRMQWGNAMARLKGLEAELERSNIWDDPVAAAKCLRERGSLVAKVQSLREIEAQLVEQVEMAELAHEDNDSQMQAEVTNALALIRRTSKEMEIASLLDGKHDALPCFLEVQSGAGGTESCDWAAMVMRMYKLWAARRGFNVTEVDETEGEDAGIKKSTIRLDGEFAFGLAKTEAGVHRLVRISPFDSASRRHTSFASVAVMPVLDDADVVIQIKDEDLRIDRFRAGGAGGQHVNKTESAVRIVHIPTGIVSQSQSDRSQHKNKETALKLLRSRLYEIEMKKRAECASQHRLSAGFTSWGNQIRSYVLQPYQLVKDLRTGCEDSDPAAVLDGDLDRFIYSFLSTMTTPMDGGITKRVL